MRHVFLALIMLFGATLAASAQTLQSILQSHVEEIASPSRNSVGVALDDLVASGLPQVIDFLEQWVEKNVWQRGDGTFFIAAETDNVLTLTDIDTGEQRTAPAEGFTQLKPNGGVRRVIGTALVQFQLSDPDLTRRETAVASIARRPEAAQMAPLLASIDGETDAALKTRKIQLANLLSARFAQTPTDRIAAIDSLATDTSVEVRAVLNQILSTSSGVALSEPDSNTAAIIDPFLEPDVSYATLVEAGLAPARQTAAEIKGALEANIVDGRIGGLPLVQMDDPDARVAAYGALAADGKVPEL
ncbi:urea ABC transporter permease subunit UrtB, partial [Octadecabacter sp.]|nr:urea ABC transporter permease subunit UrtB [Octadecabacter sp.]